MKRDSLSKLDLAESYYRGGFEEGYQQALANVKAVLAAAEAHVSELERWALADPSVEADPPSLSLAAT